MCGEMDESLHHFLEDCIELRVLRSEIFCREVGGRDWIFEILTFSLDLANSVHLWIQFDPLSKLRILANDSLYGC